MPSSRNRKIGLFFLTGPFIGLFLVIATWAVANFIISSSYVPSVETVGSASTGTGGFIGSDAVGSSLQLGEGDSRQAAARILNASLGFLGILFVFASMVGIPLGIVFLLRKDMDPSVSADERSGKGEASVVPLEIQRFSWGGFGLGWIWGLSHGVWSSLLVLIPVVGWIARLYLGFKGHELAWRKNRWVSVASFQESQHAWNIIGGLLAAARISAIVLVFCLFLMISLSSS